MKAKWKWIGERGGAGRGKMTLGGKITAMQTKKGNRPIYHGL